MSRPVLSTAVLGVVLSLAFLVPPALSLPLGEGSVGNDLLVTSLYDPPTSSVETLLNRGDGQFFAAHAVDPFLRRPEVVRFGPEEQAYRLQRPLYGWLGWIASAGQPTLVPAALLGLTAASVGLLVGVGAALLGRAGAPPRAALLVLLLPGVLSNLVVVGPEALGASLVALGLWGWIHRGRPWWALACFALAGLIRETLLLVPAGLAAEALIHARGRGVLRLVSTALPYVAWVLVLRARLGAWPTGAIDRRPSPVPLRGLADAAPSWDGGDIASALVILALCLTALLWGDRALRWVTGAHLALAVTLHEAVWGRWLDFGRVLLPIGVFGGLALARRLAKPAVPSDLDVTGVR